MVVVSFALRPRHSFGAGARTASDDLIGASEGNKAAFFEIANIEAIVVTAQFSEVALAKLRNRLRLLTRKLDREEAIQRAGGRFRHGCS